VCRSYHQSPDRELFKGLARDRVLRRRVTGPRGSQGPPRSSSIRTRATVAEVIGWRFIFPYWDSPNLSSPWETHRKRITAVSPMSTDRNITTAHIFFFFFRYTVLLQDVEVYVLLHALVFTKIYT